MSIPKVGDLVKCEREHRPNHPHWKRYKGKRGTVVSVNQISDDYAEYGVVLGNLDAQPRPDGKGWTGSTNVTWFTVEELRVLESGVTSVKSC